DDGGRLGRDAGEVLARVQARDVEVGWQEGLQRDGARDFAGANEACGKLVDLRVDRFEEMLRLEEIGDAVERLVIDEDRTQQRLLRLDVVRSSAEDRCILRGLTRGLLASHV